MRRLSIAIVPFILLAVINCESNSNILNLDEVNNNPSNLEQNNQPLNENLNVNDNVAKDLKGESQKSPTDENRESQNKQENKVPDVQKEGGNAPGTEKILKLEGQTPGLPQSDALQKNPHMGEIQQQLQEKPIEDPMHHQADLQDELDRRRMGDMYYQQHGNPGEFGTEDIPLDRFDFDPSEGLSFVVQGGQKECFFEDVLLDNDRIRGAYIVSAADSLIDFTIADASKVFLFERYSEKEGEYEIPISKKGTYEICFSNYRSSEAKLITHVTHKLESSHPAHKEHINTLAKSAEQMDVKLGELESEQRLLQVRTERHLKTEESTNKRVSWYGTAECLGYITISVLQVVYIKYLLNTPRVTRTWA